MSTPCRCGAVTIGQWRVWTADGMLSADDVRLLPTPTASLAGGEPAPWKPGVQWWRQSRATRNLAGIVTGNTPEWEGGST